MGTSTVAPTTTTSTAAEPCSTETVFVTSTVMTTIVSTVTTAIEGEPEETTTIATTATTSAAPGPTESVNAECGSCKGCWWTATSPNQGCYAWDEATCNFQGPDYVFCA